MKKHNYIGYRDIISYLDIKEGDILLVSSDILRLCCTCRENSEAFDPNIFIDTIIGKVGNAGTLLFPTYNWDFCQGKVFDYRNSASQAGALGNVALKRDDFKRTKHPIYSFAVCGYCQGYFCELNNVSAFGPDSPYAFLFEKHAKNLFVGVDYNPLFTPLHYIEEKVGVSYRYFKDFTAPYKEENGNTKIVTYRMYVRKLELCSRSAIHPDMDDILLEKGYYQKYLFNDIPFNILRMHSAGDLMERDIRKKGGLIYPKK